MLNIARQMALYGTNRMCKVCVLGANGGIGRHLALKLKLNKFITDISLYDISDTKGVATDISHIDTKSRIEGYSGSEEELIKALVCSDIVVIVAGKSHSAEFTSREAMFGANAKLMVSFMKATACACSKRMPLIHIVSNPVNGLVPVCAEYLKWLGCYNPRKLCGSSSIDATRARTFLAELFNYDPSKVSIPVIGGHSAGSITPIVSSRIPNFEMTLDQEKKLANRITRGALEVIEAKKGHGAAQLSLAHTIERFCNNVCRCIYGEDNVVEMGYVASDLNELEFFSCYFTMNADGVKECLRLPPMTDFEIERYYAAVKDIKASIKQAQEFVSNYIKEQSDE